MTETTRLDQIAPIVLCSEAYVIYDNKVLLFKRSPDSKNFPNYWIGPGGHIDAGEDPLAAAIREVREETGVELDSKNITLKGIATHHHLDKNKLFIAFVFVAKIPHKQEVSIVTTEGEGNWIEINDALQLENTFPPVKYYFDHLLNEKPGIMYTNIEWENGKLIRILSQNVDANS